MGQYYKPILLSEDNKPIAFFYSHDFGSGLKLMEHSWMKNDFVRSVEKLLILQPQKLVWAGDYADKEAPETLTKEEIKLIKASYDSEEYRHLVDTEGADLYELASVTALRITHDEGKKSWGDSIQNVAPLRYKYLVNHTKKEFVNKASIPVDLHGWQIHPLPLLTCEGNGRGGGDFRNDNDFVGTWARDVIGVVSKKADIPKDFKEIKPGFIE